MSKHAKTYQKQNMDTRQRRQKTAPSTYRIFDRPVREAVCVTQVLQVVYVTEEFMLQLWISDVRDGTVLVQGSSVAHEARCEICQVGCQFLNHVATHFVAPDDL